MPIQVIVFLRNCPGPGGGEESCYYTGNNYIGQSIAIMMVMDSLVRLHTLNKLTEYLSALCLTLVFRIFPLLMENGQEIHGS